MQFVLTKLSWQVVEVYHILVAELHDLDDFFRSIVGKAYKCIINGVWIAIDGVVDGGVHVFVKVFHGAQVLEVFWGIDDVFVCVVSLDMITCRGVFRQGAIHLKNSWVATNEYHGTVVASLGTIIF